MLPLTRLEYRALRPSPKLLRYITIATIALSILILKASLQPGNKQPGKCRMTYMHPKYIQMRGESTKHPKYRVFLYREGGVHHSKNVQEEEDHSPSAVIFIPGHCGDYAQARSLGSRLAYTLRTKDIRLYTFDLNEEYSAFHGKTLLDQAAYVKQFIESLAPKRCIILAHSMGGIVARYALMLIKNAPQHVQAVITMSSPHAAPPAPLDYHLCQIYNELNHHAPIYNATLIPLLNIAGGDLDTLIDSTSTHLPRATGALTTFTASLEDTWTSTEHDQIVWCRQVVDKIVHTVDSILFNDTSPGEVFDKVFMQAERRIEHGVTIDEVTDIHATNDTIDKSNVVESIYEAKHGTYFIPRGGDHLTILTNREDEDLQILGLRSDDSWIDISPLLSKLPGVDETLRLLRCDHLDAVYIALPNGKGWVTVEWTVPQHIEISEQDTMFHTKHIDIRNSSLVTTFNTPQYFLVYRLRYTPRAEKMHSENLKPFMRISSLHPAESKYITDIKDAIIGRGLSVMLWGADGEVTVSLDFYRSLGALGKRYRTIIVVVPFVVITWVLRIGSLTGYPSLENIIASNFPRLLIKFIALFSATSLIHSVSLNNSSNFLLHTLHHFNEDILLGNEQSYSLIPIYLALSLGWSIALSYLTWMFIRITSATTLFFRKHVYGNRHPTRFATKEKWFIFFALCTAVLVAVPHQVAFLVIYLLQLRECVITYQSTKKAVTSSVVALLHFQHMLLTLYTLALTCALPILLVFLRNLRVGYVSPLLPLSWYSDHNPLLFLPFAVYTLWWSDRVIVDTGRWTTFASLLVMILGIRNTWFMYFACAGLVGIWSFRFYMLRNKHD